MDDFHTYQIEVRSPLDIKDLNTISPIPVILIHSSDVPPQAGAQLKVCTDQCGLIGLLRHLHGRGIVLLSVHCES